MINAMSFHITLEIERVEIVFFSILSFALHLKSIEFEKLQHVCRSDIQINLT